MEPDGTDAKNYVTVCEEDPSSALNSTVLNYYKKFGRKRDLEQYFSLSTAQSEVKDPSGLFWRRMKSQYESSDSCEKKSESSTEVCRISIKCSVPDTSTSSQDGSNNVNPKDNLESPPIISDEKELDNSRHSEPEIEALDLNTSQKSFDPGLDTSTNKPLSPTHSITYQRKLEWDSLADVGYANECDRKKSGSSLSTLERMALQQQYSNNDNLKSESAIGLPTAQSTPVDINKETKPKLKSSKSHPSKTTKVYSREVDVVKVNVPPLDNVQALNVNLTKHISFNVDKQSGVVTEIIANKSPDKVSIKTDVMPVLLKYDKEIQTTLTKSSTGDQSISHSNKHSTRDTPFTVNLNSLKKSIRNKKHKYHGRTKRSKRRINNVQKNNDLSCQDKSGDPVSEAESFEYMPGHIYNQNQQDHNAENIGSICGNKSSLESSGGVTTESSKMSKSFTKDLENGVELLNNIIQQHHDNSKLKKKIIKDIVLKLMRTKYRDDDTTTEFLSGLTFDSSGVRLGQGNYTTTSTSDANNSASATKHARTRKSILRMSKLSTNTAAASTTQSVPNLPLAFNSGMNLKHKLLHSNSETDGTSKDRTSSDGVMTSSEELYIKYLEALKKEQIYRKHLKDKENFLKQKLVCSETSLKPTKLRMSKINELITDLTRKNYDDGSGDASKLESALFQNPEDSKYDFIKKRQSHTVFTMSSGNSDNKSSEKDNRSKNKNMKQKVHEKINQPMYSAPSTSKEPKAANCSCPHHSSRFGVTDSAVQVNVNSLQNYSDIQLKRLSGDVVADGLGELKYVCFCTENCVLSHNVPDNVLIYKCSRLSDGENASDNNSSVKESNHGFKDKSCKFIQTPKDHIPVKSNKFSRSSQTNVNLALHSLQLNINDDSCLSRTRKTNLDLMPDRKNVTTQCIQTDITINPKISDPSLTDVNYITSDTQKEPADTMFLTENILNNNKMNYDQQVEIPDIKKIKQTTKSKKESSSFKLECDPNCNVIECTAGKYTIPLNGTKMALTVDIGEPGHGFNVNNNKSTVDQGVVTESVNFSEKATSLQDECSKAIQSRAFQICSSSSDTNIHDKNKMKLFRQRTHNHPSGNEQIKDKAVKTDDRIVIETENSESVEYYAKNTDNIHYKEETHITPKTLSNNVCKNAVVDSLLNTCHNSESSKYKTYPPPIKKTLVRNNTDSNILPSTSGTPKFKHMKTVDVNKNSTPPQTRRDIDTEISKIEVDVDKVGGCEKSKSPKKSQSQIFNSCEVNSLGGDVENLPADLLRCQKYMNNYKSTKSSDNSSSGDPILELIKDITRRYSKHEIERNKRKKCFKDIMTVLNYLLDTDNSENDRLKTDSVTSCECLHSRNVFTVGETVRVTSPKIKVLDKGVQHEKKQKLNTGESSDNPCWSDLAETSSDSAAYKLLNKIKTQCEKYNQKRSKLNAKIEASSTTSVSCDKCKKTHQCTCKVTHKCKNHRATNKASADKAKRRCVAYNLIIQTSDSVVTEETILDKNRQPLRNIIVKVPSKKRNVTDNTQQKDNKFERTKNYNVYSTHQPTSRSFRSRSLPNDSDSADEALRQAHELTVRQYLEKNRPEFVERSAKRQNCLKMTNEIRRDGEDGTPHVKMVVVHQPQCYCMPSCNMYYRGMIPNTCCQTCLDPYCQYVESEVTRIGRNPNHSRATQRTTHRKLLSLRLDSKPQLSAASATELRNMAEELGIHLAHKNPAPKFMSEKEMKLHSERIYKTLPEVQQKKEALRKEKIKKTNLIMASLFKKHLQKKTLRGSVNISNYSTVIKI